MKNKCMILLLCLTYQTCLSQQIFPTSKQFNAQAKDYFLKHFDSFGLSQLNVVEECLLKDAVMNNLDALNGSKMVVIGDRFLLKSYFEPFLEMEFAFIMDIAKNDFYFVCLPELYKRTFEVGSYYRQSKEVFKLRGPMDLVALEDSLINDFFESKVFRENHASGGIESAMNIMHEAFGKTMGSLLPNWEFVQQVEESHESNSLSIDTYEKILRILNAKPDVEQEIESYFLEQVGYLMIIYKQNTAGITCSIYLLPQTERFFIDRPNLVPKYRNCDLKE